MLFSSRYVRLAAVLLAAVALAACATLKVNSYTERGATFDTYRTYAWGPAAAMATGDPRLDNNPFFHERLLAEADKQLVSRGFQKITSDDPDLTIHYHVSITQEIEVSGIDREYGYCQTADCRRAVYDAGTLVMDLIDARTNRLVWRGWAEDSFEGVVDNQQWMEQKITDAVDSILKRLPQRSAPSGSF
jgi:hypothetical protein